MAKDPISGSEDSAESTDHLSPGFLVGGGRFSLVRLLARGGMGVVWLANDERLRELAALKFISSKLRDDPTALPLLRQETQRSRKLSHPNIVRIHDLYESPDEAAFISMEYVHGANLWECMTQQPTGIYSWKALKPLVKQICDALDYAHGEGVIHRDLKPTNLILAENGRLRLADFGLAVGATPTQPGSGERRFGGGTLTHMSPQQLQAEPAAVTDDIYSLGATLYDLLCGRPPFHEGDIRQQLLNQDPQPLQDRLASLAVPSDVPSEVAALIMACLAKNPSSRPQSAASVAEWVGLSGSNESATPALTASISNSPPPKPEPEAETASDEAPPKSRTFVFAAAGVICLILAVLVFSRKASPTAARLPVPKTNEAAIDRQTHEPAPPAISSAQDSAPVSRDVYVSAVMSLNPLGFWRLDELDGTVAADSAHEFDGAYTNVVTGQAGRPAPAGLSSTAALFGLNKGATGFVTIPGFDLGVPSGKNGRLSVAAWMQPSVVPQSEAKILSKGIAGGREQFCLDFGGRGGTYRFFTRSARGDSAWVETAFEPDFRWHFLAGVYDQPGDRIYIYVDGTNAGTSSAWPGAGILSTPHPAIIGSAADSAGIPHLGAFSGKIQDVAIFTNALSAGEVMSLYKAATSALPAANTPAPVSAGAESVMMDSEFESGTGADGEINDLVQLSDGSILICGRFNMYDGTSHAGLVRLSANGKPDARRFSLAGAGDAMSVLPDGRIIIVGDFASVGGIERNRMARLLPGLAVDQSFSPPSPDGEALCVSCFNNMIVVGGAFEHIGGTEFGGVARFDREGQLDMTFKSGAVADGRVLAAELQPDGKTLIGGVFSRIRNSGKNCFGRLLSDGRVQNLFQPVVDGCVRAIVTQPDGRILIGGDFTTVHRVPGKGVGRLRANGKLDETFNPGAGANLSVKTIALQGDGRIIAGGAFTSFNGISRNHIARLNSDGSLDATFSPKLPGAEVRKILVLRDGKILVICQYGGDHAALFRLAPVSRAAR